jgi:16S rRNA C967 or C1407 C5-methylase (RsmB/RsmF family)
VLAGAVAVAAAPGSKAGLLAELMENEDLLVANDVNEGRAFNLVSNSSASASATTSSPSTTAGTTHPSRARSGVG